LIINIPPTRIVPITVEYVSGIIIPKEAAPKMKRSTTFKFVDKYPSIAELKPVNRRIPL
jgi:hypothetical protein